MLTVLVNLIIFCAVLGVVWWITTVIPMPPPIRMVANVAIGLIALFLLLGLVGWVPLGVHLYRIR